MCPFSPKSPSHPACHITFSSIHSVFKIISPIQNIECPCYTVGPSLLSILYSSVYMSTPVSRERRFLTYTLTDKTHWMPKQHTHTTNNTQNNTRQPKPKKKQKSNWPKTIPGPILIPQTLVSFLRSPVIYTSDQ